VLEHARQIRPGRVSSAHSHGERAGGLPEAGADRLGRVGPFEHLFDGLDDVDGFEPAFGFGAVVGGSGSGAVVGFVEAAGSFDACLELVDAVGFGCGAPVLGVDDLLPGAPGGAVPPLGVDVRWATPKR
jgi:hypothetical protein